MLRTSHDYWMVKDLGPEGNDGVLHCITEYHKDDDEEYVFILATACYAEIVAHFRDFKDRQRWLDAFIQDESRYVWYINGKTLYI